MRKMTDKGDQFFSGLEGTVTVGEGQMSLEPVGKPADRPGAAGAK
jgi:hypothetical protein